MARVPVQYQQGAIKHTVRTAAMNKKVKFQFRSTIVVRYTLYTEAMVTRSHVIQMESENGTRTESLPFKCTWCILQRSCGRLERRFHSLRLVHSKRDERRHICQLTST